MRSIQATHNMIAVSASTAETAINAEQTLNTTMLFDLGSVIELEPRREDNSNEAIGKEEADTIYDNGAVSKATLSNEKAQPQHFAFLLAYALSNRTTAAAGTGYQHTITPLSGDLDGNRSIRSFTAAQRYGNTVLKRRFASMFVDQVVATFARDSWVKISGSIKGTGKKTDNVVKETVSAAGNATSLTLAAAAVQGADAATRLDNVQAIRVQLTTGIWTDVAYSAVSSATPAVITITSPGGTSSPVNYEIIYIPTESGWMTFPARITEDPLRVAQMTLNVGGAWNGTAYTGGRALSAEMKSLEWTFNNNLEVEFVPGAGGAYAARAIRNGRTQKIKLDKEFRDFILKQHIADNDTFGIYVKAEGALYDGSNKYQVEIIFPKVAVLDSPISVDGKRLAEAGDLQVLEDSTYGSVIVKVKNLQSTYAA